MNVEIKTYKVAEVELWERNPRRIKPEARERLKNSLGRFGLVDLPVVNESGETKTVISGNQRISILKETDPDGEFQAIKVDFDEETLVAAALEMNNKKAEGRFTIEAGNILDELREEGEVFGDLGFDALEAEIAKLQPKGATVEEAEKIGEMIEGPSLPPDDINDIPVECPTCKAKFGIPPCDVQFDAGEGEIVDLGALK